MAVAAVALCTLLIYPLKQVAPVVSLGVVYLLAVLVVSAIWGAWLGVATAVLSAAAFNFFHLPPVGQFDDQGLEQLGRAGHVPRGGGARELGRRGHARPHARRRGAPARGRPGRRDGAAAAAREQPRRGPAHGRGAAGARARAELGGDRDGGGRGRRAHESRSRCARAPARLGTLLVGADTSEASLRRLQERVVPALEALLSAALEREGLLGGVVETAALRRADTVKTALLRAVSHDLRSPLTAISAAGEAVGSPSLSQHEREEMAAVIQEEARRLSRLVDNLLDLSRLEAGAAEPRRDWTSVEELIRAALRGAGGGPGGVQPVDRPRPAAGERRPGADGAGVRERARERAPALRRPSGVGARPRGAQPRARSRAGPWRPAGRLDGAARRARGRRATA